MSPGAAASLPLSLGPDAPRAGRLGSLVGSPGRQGDPGLGRGGRWRAAVSPAGAAGATETERPWSLGTTKQRGNPNTGGENLALFSLLSHHPVVPGDRRLTALSELPRLLGCRCVLPQARDAFCFSLLLAGQGVER